MDASEIIFDVIRRFVFVGPKREEPDGFFLMEAVKRVIDFIEHMFGVRGIFVHNQQEDAAVVNRPDDIAGVFGINVARGIPAFYSALLQYIYYMFYKFS